MIDDFNIILNISVQVDNHIEHLSKLQTDTQKAVAKLLAAKIELDNLLDQVHKEIK